MVLPWCLCSLFIALLGCLRLGLWPDGRASDPLDTTSFTSMVLTPAWVARVGRASLSVVFVCRLGRVARPASPHDTARFTSMVFTLGVMALLDLFGGVFSLDLYGRVFAPSPPRKHRRIAYNCRPAWPGGRASEPARHRSLHFYGFHAWRDGLA